MVQPVMKRSVSYSHVWLFVIPCAVAHRLLCPWNSPGKNTGVGCNFLLQGIFLTQGKNLGLLHCRQILYHLSYQVSPFSLWLGLIKLSNCPCMLSYFSCVWLFCDPWTVASQAPLSMGFPRQEHRYGLPFPSLGDLPNPGIEPKSHVSCIAGRFFTTSTTRETIVPLTIDNKDPKGHFLRTKVNSLIVSLQSQF